MTCARNRCSIKPERVARLRMRRDDSLSFGIPARKRFDTYIHACRWHDEICESMADRHYASGRQTGVIVAHASGDAQSLRTVTRRRALFRHRRSKQEHGAGRRYYLASMSRIFARRRHDTCIFIGFEFIFMRARLDKHQKLWMLAGRQCPGDLSTKVIAMTTKAIHIEDLIGAPTLVCGKASLIAR